MFVASFSVMRLKSPFHVENLLSTLRLLNNSKYRTCNVAYEDIKSKSEEQDYLSHPATGPLIKIINNQGYPHCG